MYLVASVVNADVSMTPPAPDVEQNRLQYPTARGKADWHAQV